MGSCSTETKIIQLFWLKMCGLIGVYIYKNSSGGKDSVALYGRSALLSGMFRTFLHSTQNTSLQIET